MQLSSHAPSRTSIPRELLVESVRQPYDTHDVHARVGTRLHTQKVKCRDKSWKYRNRWKVSVLLDDEPAWVDSTVFGQYQCW